MSKSTHSLVPQTIVYVNFSPYENAGRILDFLTDTYKNVLLFSFNFYSLGKKHDKTQLLIYESGVLKRRLSLYQLTFPPRLSLIFLLLPIRSILISLQIVYCLLLLKRTYTSYDVYFTVNAYTAFTGNILKKLGLVKKTVFWVWDYYPPVHENKIVQIMRWLYWQFDKAASHADRLVFLNKRLEELRKDIGMLPKNEHHTVIPIGTDPIHTPKKKNRRSPVLVFIGVLKRSQGLDLIFESSDRLHALYPRLKLEVIGAGPDERYFRKLSRQTGISTIFHGFVPHTKDIQKILQRSSIGLATYRPEESNVSYYGDPSKIKMYLSQAIPVITTNVFEFSKEIHQHQAGVVIGEYTPEAFVQALNKIISNYPAYQKRALRLAWRYEYRKIYRHLIVFGEPQVNR